MAKKTKLKEGVRVRTNDKWSKRLGFGQWTGTLVHPDTTIEGTWYVKLDRVDLPRPLPISGYWLEAVA